jgi:hypothetical protein
MADIRIVASGLRFPEGPVAMADGSVILGEIAGGAVILLGVRLATWQARPVTLLEDAASA